MHLLDNQKQFSKYDRSGILRSIDLLAEQAEQAWQESHNISLPAGYNEVHEIVMNGMGGSGLAGHVIEAAFRDRLRVPFFLTHSYDVPAHVRAHTLYILSSYSGNTEEILSSRDTAQKMDAKLLAISSGGLLGKDIEKGRIPGYLFSGSKNIGNQPRFGLGYTIFGVLGLLRAADLLKLSHEEVTEAIESMRSGIASYCASVPLIRNKAKQFALKLQGKIPIFIGAEFLEDSARIMTNQLHENAKQFGFHFAIPELNHHLMEGLRFPKGFHEKLTCVFLSSNLNHPRVQKRFPITESVFKRHNIDTQVYKPKGATPFAQLTDALAFGSYLTYYLSILNKVDPTPNPWVDYFKKKLGT